MTRSRPTTAEPAAREALPAWVESLAEGREPLWTPVVCGLLTLIGWLGPTLLGLPRWAEITAFAGAYIAGGTFSLIRSVKSLRQRRLDIDLLMLLSAVGAGVIGEYAEGATLLFLFSLSNALESRALRRTTTAIESLMELRPDEALQLDAQGHERWVAADELKPGDLVRVRPGGRIPVDGHVRAGFTAADQAAITGESEPVEKGPGDRVFSGTINVGGTIDIEVDKLAAESTLSRIIELVEEAREAKAPTQRFIDRFEQGYAATVIFAALAATVLPLLFGESFHSAFYRAMTLLVVASPCAVVISTPATILAALAHAARRGLLFKGGAPLEELATVDTAAFDKTGTLTAGKATVLEVVGFGASKPERVLSLAAAVGRLSEHHLGRAIFDEVVKRGTEPPKALELRSQRGLGAVAEVAGQSAVIGRLQFAIEEGGLELTAEEDRQVEELARQGRSLVFVVAGEDKGVVALEDQVRPEAAAALRSLKANGVERTVLLTGDHQEVASRVAEQVGVDEVKAQLMPEDKVALIRGLASGGRQVAMVGDGVNDAPALAASSVGVAMGLAGTDAALEVADLVLVRDRLDDLAYALRLAKRSLRIIRQNLAFACAVIAVLVVINLLYGLPLPVGVVGHEGSTILVVLNGLRLLRPLPAEGELQHQQ